VVIQVLLMALVGVSPGLSGGRPPLPEPATDPWTMAGAVLCVAGGLLFVGSLWRLGPSLTALPAPKDDATLVVRGPYAVVRHPIYSGGIVLAFGWALVWHSWPAAASAAALAVFLDCKSRREERWLVGRYPGYRDYQRRVRRFVPYIY